VLADDSKPAIEMERIMTDIDRLEGSGIRATSARLKIINLLESSQRRHLRAEDIHRELIDSGEHIGIATVYRTLTQFEAAGIVQRHNFDDDHAVYELSDGEHHDHMVCTKCGAVKEFVDHTIEQCQLDIAQKNNFKMTDHQLVIFGLCAGCCS
jgi:Fur family transcriptional regulator, ferric uptake regulator